MTGIQLLTTLAALSMSYASYTRFRRRELRAAEFVVWMAVWTGLAAVSLFPGWLRAVIAPLAVARVLDLVVIGGILTLGIIVFNLNHSLRRLDNRLQTLVQRLALQSARDAAGEGQDSREVRAGDPAEASADRA